MKNRSSQPTSNYDWDMFINNLLNHRGHREGTKGNIGKGFYGQKSTILGPPGQGWQGQSGRWIRFSRFLAELLPVNNESRCASGQVIEEGDWFYFFDGMDGIYYNMDGDGFLVGWIFGAGLTVQRKAKKCREGQKPKKNRRNGGAAV